MNKEIIENLTKEQWSEVLIEALPYFKQWVGKVVVVKYGGNAMLNEELKKAVMEDIVLLNTIDISYLSLYSTIGFAYCIESFPN